MIIYKGCRYRNSCPYPGAVRHPGGVSSKHRKRKIISPMKAPCLPPLTKSKGICLLYFVWVPGYGTQNFAHARLTNKLYLSPPSFLFWAKLSLCCSGRSWSHGPPAPASLIAGIAGAYLHSLEQNSLTFIPSFGTFLWCCSPEGLALWMMTDQGAGLRLSCKPVTRVVVIWVN